MRIRIAGTASDSIVDGSGLRYTIFTQGCFHNCPGCHNPETHDLNGGKEMDTAEIIAEFKKNPLLSGITLSGGEPFLQAEACLEIAKAAHAIGKDVWAYTGYTLEELRSLGDEHILALLDEVDVLVDGKFHMEERSLELRFRGSKNQRLIDMKKTGRGEPVEWEKEV